MSRTQSLLNLFNDLNNDYQCILISYAYDLLQEQERERNKNQTITKGSRIFEQLERLNKLKVIGCKSEKLDSQ